MATIENIIKDFIVEDIFCEYPTDLNPNGFDFFMRSGIDATVTVGETPLSYEWGFEVCEEYEWENIRALRGLMQSRLDDQMKLQEIILKKDEKKVDNDKLSCELSLTAFDIVRYEEEEIYRMVEEKFAKVGLRLEILEMDMIPTKIEGHYVTYRCVPIDHKRILSSGDVHENSESL